MDSLSEKLTELISQIQYMGGLESRLAEHLIANGVTIPVRCKDCTHCDIFQGETTVETMMMCMIHSFEIVNPTDYCSYGERRADENP